MYPWAWPMVRPYLKVGRKCLLWRLYALANLDLALSIPANLVHKTTAAVDRPKFEAGMHPCFRVAIV
eukprot:SAG31_NODE_130_length_23424_cov_45.648802_10_plen_67_part_00